MSNIVIRKAVPEDAETIIDINIEVWNTTYKDLIPQEIIDKLQSKDPERIARNQNSIREKQHTFVAEVDGKIVGFHTFGKTRDENFGNAGEIYAGYILDGYQGLGLGRKMAVACMKELLDKGYTTLVTKCLDGNPSNEFHKSLGGKFVGQSTFEPMGIYVGKENIYYHEDLAKSLEYNIEKLNKKNNTEGKLWLRELTENDGLDGLKYLQEIVNEEGIMVAPAPKDIDETTYPEWLKTKADTAKGINMPEGYIPCTTYWVMLDDKIIGLANIKHYLNDFLRKKGGHLGLSLAKEYRGKGLGYKTTLLLIDKARTEFGIDDILLTNEPDNIASRKLCEKLGAELTDIDEHCHYWIKNMKKVK